MKQQCIPPIASRSHLKNAAFNYLKRFSSSSQNLRNILRRRVQRSAYYHDTDLKEGNAYVDEIIAHLIDIGLLDDTDYAKKRVRSYHNKGNSRLAIIAKIRAKGINQKLIENALSELQQELIDDLELVAALKFAKKRYLGLYRVGNQSDGRREKDISILTRAGFGFNFAQIIVDAKIPEELISDVEAV